MDLIKQLYSGWVTMRWNRYGTVGIGIRMQLRIEPVGCYELLRGKLQDSYVGDEGVQFYVADPPTQHRQTQLLNYFVSLVLLPSDVVHAAQISTSRHTTSETLAMFLDRYHFALRILCDWDRVCEELFVLTGYEAFLNHDQFAADPLVIEVKNMAQKAVHVLRNVLNYESRIRADLLHR